MRIPCESCKTHFEIDDSEISDNENEVHCSKCGHVFMVGRQDPDDLYSEFEAELKDLGRFLIDQTENGAPAGEKTPSFRREESSRIPEESPGISFEEFMKKEGQSLESRESEPPVSEDLNSSEPDPLDEDLPEEGGAKETDSQPSPPSESSEVRGIGESGASGRNRGRIILCLISAILGGIVTALLIPFVMMLSGGSFWPRASLQPVDMELLEDRLNNRISLLDGRYEELETRVSQTLQRYQGMDAWVSQATMRLGELEEKLGKLANSQKNKPPEHGAGQVSVKGVERIPRDDSSTRSAGDARSLYQNAYQNYERGDYRGAIAEFQQFVQTYPSDDLADNAHYWIGESYYAQGDFQEAITIFMKVVDQYPGGNKTADALLKIGFSYSNLNEAQKAREFLTQVMTKYPSTEAARKAKLKLENMPQP